MYLIIKQEFNKGHSIGKTYFFIVFTGHLKILPNFLIDLTANIAILISIVATFIYQFILVYRKKTSLSSKLSIKSAAYLPLFKEDPLA